MSRNYSLSEEKWNKKLDIIFISIFAISLIVVSFIFIRNKLRPAPETLTDRVSCEDHGYVWIRNQSYSKCIKEIINNE